MKYILTAAWDDGVADLTQRLVKELAEGKRVLWLLSGGSNIPTSVQIMDTISATQSRHLTVSLIDERYGEPGHHDSNWEQLVEAGFKGKQAKLLPVLHPDTNFEQTAERYEAFAAKAFVDCDIIVAQLGIGSDGHIAGILPDSPAVDAEGMVAAYDAPPLKRLTLTFEALRHISAAYVFAFGKPKHKTLVALHDKALPLARQPAQILKELPEVYLYSDQVGSHV